MQLLGNTIHDKIKHFKDNGADKGCVSVWLNDCVEVESTA